MQNDGRIRLRLKRPWSDGTTHMVYEPVDFLTKLAALIPPPRKHQITYGGVFSAHSKLRPQIIPRAPEATPQAEAESLTPCRKHAKRMEWARLIARVFEIDVITCPRCHTKGMQAIASIMDRNVIDKILRSVGMPTDSPEFAPPALPQQAAFDFA